MERNVADIKASLLFLSPLTRSQAFAALVQLLFSTKDHKEKATCWSLLWSCLIDFGPIVGGWAEREIVRRLSTGDIPADRALTEALVLLTPERATNPSILRIALLATADLNRTCSHILKTDGHSGEHIVSILREMEPRSVLSTVFALLVKDDLRQENKIMLAEYILNALPEVEECFFDTVASRLPLALVNDLRSTKGKTMFLMESKEALSPSMRHSLSVDSSLLLEYGDLLMHYPEVLLNEEIPRAHHALLPTLLTLVAAEGEIEKASPGFLNKEVLMKAKQMVASLSTIGTKSEEMPCDDHDMTTFEFLQWTSGDKAVLRDYVCRWLCEMNCISPTSISSSFVVGSLSSSNPEDVIPSLSLLSSFCEMKPELASTVVLVYLSMYTRPWFTVSKEDILRELGRVCTHRLIVPTVLKFLLVVCQQKGAESFVAIDVIGTLIEKYDSIFDQIRPLCTIAEADPPEWARAKLGLMKRICKCSDHTDDLLPHLSALLNKGGPLLPNILDTVSVLCEEGVFDVSQICPQTRSKSSVPGQEAALAMHAKILSLAVRDEEQQEFADQALRELWTLTAHSSEAVRAGAYNALCEYTWEAVSEHIDSLYNPSNDEGTVVLLEKKGVRVVDVVLERLQNVTMDGVEERLALTKFLHKMVQCDLEQLPRPLFTKKYTSGDDTFSNATSTLFDEKQNSEADVDFLALVPTVLNCKPSSSRPSHALQLFSKGLTQVSLPEDDCEWTGLRYLSAWRVTVQSVFHTLSAARREQVIEGAGVMVWTRDHVCEELRRALLQCESSLGNVVVGLTYLALIVNGKEDTPSNSQYELGFRPWITSVVEFLLSQMDESHLCRAQPIFQCEVKPNRTSRDLAGVCLALITKHVAEDDLSFFTFSVDARASGHHYARHWMRSLANRDEGDRLSRVAHQLFSLSTIAPADLHCFDRIKLALTGFAIGCDPMTIEMAALNRAPNAAVVEEVQRLCEMADTADDVQTLFHFYCDLDDGPMETYRLKLKKKTEKMVKENKGEDGGILKTAIWKGLATYYLSLCGRSMSNLPRDYSMLPDKSLIREMEARIRTASPAARLVLLSAWCNQCRKNDARHLPPIDISFMTSYLQDGEDTVETVWRLAAQQGNVKVLSQMSTPQFLDSTPPPFLPVTVSELPRIVPILTETSIRSIVGYVMTSLRNLEYKDEEMLKSVCGQAKNQLFLSAFLPYLPVVSSALSFTHPIWRNCVGVLDGERIRGTRGRLVDLWLEVQHVDTMRIATVLELLKEADLEERYSLVCLFGSFCQRLSEEKRMIKLSDTLTEARIQMARGEGELSCHWWCVLSLIAVTPSPVPFNFLSTDDMGTVDALRRRIPYYLKYLMEIPTFGVIVDKVASFLLVCLTHVKADDSVVIRKLLRRLLATYHTVIAPLIDEENAWETIFRSC